MAAHVKLQAEVTGRGERAEFALKCLASVLVLMYLQEKHTFGRPTANSHLEGKGQQKWAEGAPFEFKCNIIGTQFTH